MRTAGFHQVTIEVGIIQWSHDRVDSKPQACQKMPDQLEWSVVTCNQDHPLPAQHPLQEGFKIAQLNVLRPCKGIHQPRQAHRLDRKHRDAFQAAVGQSIHLRGG